MKESYKEGERLFLSYPKYVDDEFQCVETEAARFGWFLTHVPGGILVTTDVIETNCPALKVEFWPSSGNKITRMRDSA